MLYVAGPMSGYPRWNFDAFDEATAQLRAAGHSVYSPAEIERKGGFDPDAPVDAFTQEDREAAMKRDLDFVLFVDALALLPGWEDSAGAGLEVAVAKAIGTPTAPLSHYLTEKGAE